MTNTCAWPEALDMAMLVDEERRMAGGLDEAEAGWRALLADWEAGRSPSSLAAIAGRPEGERLSASEALGAALVVSRRTAIASAAVGRLGAEQAAEARDALMRYMDAVLRLAAEREPQLDAEALGHLAHDLRGPINALAGALELTRGFVAPKLEGREARLLNMALRASDTLVEAIDGLIEGAGAPDVLSPCPLGPAVAEALTAVAPLAEANSVRIEGAGADEVVLADAQRLEQALVTMLAQTIQHAKAGDRVTVGVEGDAAGVRVSVALAEGTLPAMMRSLIGARYPTRVLVTLKGAGAFGDVLRARHAAERMGGGLSVGEGAGAAGGMILSLRRASEV